ncbi:hypothetical protein [Homoserinibacter sp. YIM 151385]|uniref:hypothetical protein n=1 Tax=Homoserinibacter sp. YIM 151385 TaxID=2985506 RepID=UPI0022F0544A|nr:hypothetical protein [Homoserinibacter sp. YIM 151385]WBU39035.1 hypothetical protein OF852_05505 [Homoserinibacter sp. YIM 151385]
MTPANEPPAMPPSSPIDGISDEELLRRSAEAPDAAARAAVFGFDLAALRVTRRRLSVLVTGIAAGAAFLVFAGWSIPAQLIADERVDYLAVAGGFLAQLVPPLVVFIATQIMARAVASATPRRIVARSEPIVVVLHSAAVVGLMLTLTPSPGLMAGALAGAMLSMLVLVVPDVALADLFGKPHPVLPLSARQIWAVPAFLTLRGGVIAPLVLGHVATAVSAALLVVVALTAPVLAIPAVVIRIVVRTGGGIRAVEGSRSAAIGTAVAEPALLAPLAIAASIIGAG